MMLIMFLRRYFRKELGLASPAVRRRHNATVFGAECIGSGKVLPKSREPRFGSPALVYARLNLNGHWYPSSLYFETSGCFGAITVNTCGIRVLPLTLALWPPEGAANKCGHPATVTLAGVPTNRTRCWHWRGYYENNDDNHYFRAWYFGIQDGSSVKCSILCLESKSVRRNTHENGWCIVIANSQTFQFDHSS